MSKVRMLAMGLVTLGAAAAAYRAMAERKYFGPARFIDAASAKGIGEIEAARLALKKGQSEGVKQFAQQMIEEHTAINRDLRQIARNKGYEMADEADMLSKTEELLLNLRESTAFDDAYLKHQVASHEHSLSLFRRAAEFDDFDVSNFAMKTRPKLEHHLKMAKDIQKDTERGSTQSNDTQQNKSAAGSRGASTTATGAAPEKDVAAGTANNYASSDIGGTTHASSGPNPGGGMPPNSAAGSSTGSTQPGPADSPTSVPGSPAKGPSDKSSRNLPGHTGGER
ncbi:Predicted outer membrane protein [Halopseudomonas xinjiangensis]|uniref:Predicted outer membrane protein n=1 Tax=Halopseudomonas xinjiangensis TaxID=487184 RepID=A0A1H1VDM8_9GAMM|nr:DUF4142 domain-containing protein [Halopseudomonas xinjiangensis]SDS82793.1 Predicted outer membrane protein [Halopseudomonas xinjiangensis]